MKRGIIVASFGTSYPETRKKCIESIENHIASTYSHCEVVRAFTSYKIIKKLKERDDIHVNTVDQALNDMFQRGVTTVHVQPLHLIPGFEYEKIKRSVAEWMKSGMDITLGKPLMHDDESVKILADIAINIAPDVKVGQGLVYMGHGTEHEANAFYGRLQDAITISRPDIHIANVEGFPELEDITNKLSIYDTVALRPLMIVAGDHAINDMAGDEEDSMKSIIEASGKDTLTILQGLGEEEAIADRFITMIKNSFTNSGLS